MQGLVRFYMKFTVDFSISWKNVTGILIGTLLYNAFSFKFFFNLFLIGG